MVIMILQGVTHLVVVPVRQSVDPKAALSCGVVVLAHHRPESQRAPGHAGVGGGSG